MSVCIIVAFWCLVHVFGDRCPFCRVFEQPQMTACKMWSLSKPSNRDLLVARAGFSEISKRNSQFRAQLQVPTMQGLSWSLDTA
jgi:hypothetical protein